MRDCPVHGHGCYGITEECGWIEADIARRHAEGECFACGAYPPDYCDACNGKSIGHISTIDDCEAVVPASKPSSPGPEGRSERSPNAT